MNKKNFFLAGNNKSLLSAGFDIILRKFNCISSDTPEGAFLIIREQQCEKMKLKIEKCGNICDVQYKEPVHFFRALAQVLLYVSQDSFATDECVHFESNGMMLDCSRNGVPKVETIKKFIEYLALFGMNRLYMYMEDTIELPGYPYWGYLRGRYSLQEIQECDRYGRLFGITLVPCIQTLAHLKTVLKLPAFHGYRDIDDVLLIDDPKVEALLKTLLTQIAKAFSGKIVHLGMDEAAYMGRGKYMDLHGSQPTATIMEKHLKWLLGECKQLGLRPMIWSDMYIKLSFAASDYYSLAENAQLKIAKALNPDVDLCYWDYYNEGKSFYAKYLKLHKRLGNPLLFAGGAWTWNGIAPNVSKAMLTTKDALSSCIETGITDVFCTVWMDNGAETPLDTCLPILALYGEYGFGNEPDFLRLKTKFEHCFDANLEDYYLLDAFDNPNVNIRGMKIQHSTDTAHNRHSENPSKTILYQDNLMGLFENLHKGRGLKKRYQILSNALYQIADSMKKNSQRNKKHIFRYYALLAELLAAKVDVCTDLRKAYEKKDVQNLRQIAADVLTKITKSAEGLRNYREQIWMEEYKAFGFENLDIRFAGIRQRALSAIGRIHAFIRGSISSIPELEEKILSYRSEALGEGDLLHGYYVWEKIIGTGNIDGI